MRVDACAGLCQQVLHLAFVAADLGGGGLVKLTPTATFGCMRKLDVLTVRTIKVTITVPH